MDITAWLRELGLQRYERAFRENEIDFELLPDLTEGDLERLGLPLGPRRKLLKAIQGHGATPGASSVKSLSEPSVTTGAERRQLTVLFCDVVGSTKLSARLDPEEMGAVIRSYQKTCSEVVTRWDGYIAKHMGDGVIAYFGWPRAHEDDAERAIRAGQELTQAVGRLPAGDGTSLAARVGIATGLVMVGDPGNEGSAKEQAVVGQAPNLAARLQAFAAPGCVAIAANTRRLVGRLFELADLGKHDLKGFAAPVQIWRVVSESRVEGRFEALRGHRMTPFVGREPELDAIGERWGWATEGDGQVVLIAGEPGIGKSRLVRILRERLSDDPFVAISHFCSPHQVNSAFHPVIGLLERASRLDRSAPPEVQLDGLIGAVSPAREKLDDVVPVLADLLSVPTGGRYPKLTTDPERRRQRTLEVLIDQAEGLASDRPLLAVYEDVHWADPSTLELLSLVIERVRQLKMLVLITFRPEFRPPWTGEAHVTWLSLSRLGRQQGATMVEHLSGKGLPAEVMNQVIAKAEGIPLFVEELTKAVLESSLTHAANQASKMLPSLPSLGVPSTLHDSLMARLDRLAPVREVAQIGAVLGREFSHTLLVKVAGRPEHELIDALQQLMAAELIYRRGLPSEVSYQFKHALVQDAAYESLLRSRRQQLHQITAQVLRNEFSRTVEAHPDLLAHHLTEAGLTESALDYWLHAGRQAAERCAYIEAIGHLSKGLELIGTLPVSKKRDEVEIQFRITLGVPLASTRGAPSPEVEENYRQARELCERHGQIEQLIPALWGLWLGAMMRKELRRTCDFADQMLALSLRQRGTALRLEARHAQWTSRLLIGEPSEAHEHSEQGVSLYSSEQHHVLAYTYGGHDPGTCCRNVGAYALWLLGYPARARDRMNAGLALSEELQHATTLADTLSMALVFCAMEQNSSALEAHAQTLLRLSASEKFQDYSSIANAGLGWILCVRKKIPAGLAMMREWRTPLLADQWIVWAPPLITLVATALGQHGGSEEGLDVVNEALRRAQHGDVHWWKAEMFRVKAELLLASCHDEAEACLMQSLEISRQQKARSLELRAAGSLAALRLRQGRRGEAYDLLAPVYRWFTEGFDTADLKDAKVLLDELT